MMEEYPIGGIFVPAWVFGGHQPLSDVVPNLRRAVQEYESASQFPLIISEDFERGLGEAYEGYTRLPSELSVGATNSEAAAFAFGETITKEARTLGVNWLLHPCGDLNVSPLNNLILERGIGANSTRSTSLLQAQWKGCSRMKWCPPSSTSPATVPR